MAETHVALAAEISISTAADPVDRRRISTWRLPRPTMEQIDAATGKLCNDHVAILRAAVAHEKYTDISAALGLPLGTVRSRLNRARAALANAAGVA